MEEKSERTSSTLATTEVLSFCWKQESPNSYHAPSQQPEDCLHVYIIFQTFWQDMLKLIWSCARISRQGDKKQIILYPEKSYMLSQSITLWQYIFFFFYMFSNMNSQFNYIFSL